MYNKRPSYTGDPRNAESSSHPLNSHDQDNDSTQAEPPRRYPYNRGAESGRKGYKNTDKPKTERKPERTEEYDDNPALETPENIPRPSRDQKFPPIITIDGRVDTDLDHLMEIDKDESKKVQTWRTYPKPHIFSVIEGSLDDDIDSIANHDGTMEHKLADPLKSFISKDGNLKKVSAKDGHRRTPGTLNKMPPNRPGLGRSMSPPLSRDIIPSDRSSNKQPSTYQSEDEDGFVARKNSVNCRDSCDASVDSGNSATYISAREVQSGVKSGQQTPIAKGSKVGRRKHAWSSKDINEHIFGDESPFSTEIQPKQCSSDLAADDSCAKHFSISSKQLSISSKQLSTQMDELLSPNETQMALWPNKNESEIESDSSSFSQRIDSVRLSTFTEATNATEITEEALVSNALESVQRTLSPSTTEDTSLARKNEMINSIKKLLNTENCSTAESVMSKPPLKVNKPISMKKPKVLKRRRSISPLTLKNKPKLSFEAEPDQKVVSVSTPESVKCHHQKPYGCRCRSVDSQICEICEIFAEYNTMIGGPKRFDLRNTRVTKEDEPIAIPARPSENVQKLKVARQLPTVNPSKYAAPPTKNIADNEEVSHSVSGACQTSSVVITLKASKHDFKASRHDVSFASTCQASELRTFPIKEEVKEVKGTEVRSACTQSPSILNENDIVKLNEKDLVKQLEAVSRDPQSSNIRSSLRAAISVAEHSMSAAAKVAQALFLVIEATRASENIARCSSESRRKASKRSCSRSTCSSLSSSSVHDDDIIASKRKLEKAMRFLDTEYPELINGYREKLKDRKRPKERSRTPSPIRRIARVRSPQRRDDYLYPLQVIEKRLRQNSSPLMYKTPKLSERAERFYYVSPVREKIRCDYMRSSMDSLMSTEVSDNQRRAMRRRQTYRDDDPISEPVWNSRPWSPQRFIKCPRRHETHSLSEGGRGACPSTSFDELTISDDTLVEQMPPKSSVRRETGKRQTGRRESDDKRERHHDKMNPRDRENRESKYPRGTIDHRFDVSPKKKSHPYREKHVLKSPHRSPTTKSGHYTQRSGSYIRQQKYRSSKPRGESKHMGEHRSSRASSPHKHQNNSLSSVEDRRETRFSPVKEYKEHRHSSTERRSKPQRSSLKGHTNFVKFKPTEAHRSAAEDERSVSPIRSVMNYVSRKLNSISSSMNDDEEFNDNAKVDALLVKYDCSPVGNVNCSHHCSYVREDRAYIDKIKRVSLYSRTFKDSWTNTSPRKCVCGRGFLLSDEQINNHGDNIQYMWPKNDREKNKPVPETICNKNASHLCHQQQTHKVELESNEKKYNGAIRSEKLTGNKQSTVETIWKSKENLVSTPNINKEQYRETNNQSEVNESESKTSLPVQQPIVHKSTNHFRDWEPSYKCGFNDSEMDTWSCSRANFGPRKSSVPKSVSDPNSDSTTSVDSSGVYF